MSIKHISVENLDYADRLIELQSLLFDLNEANLTKTVKKIYSEKLAETNDDINAIIESIISIMSVKPNFQNIMAKFCVEFFEASKLDTPASNFAILLLHRLLRITDDSEYIRKIPEIVLLSALIDTEFYVDRDYIPVMNGLFSDNFMNQFALMVICLAKIISIENPEFFESVFPVLQDMSKGKLIDEKLCKFIDNFNIYKENDFELIDFALNDPEQVPLVTAIINDNPEELESLQDFNVHIKFNILQPCKLLRNSPTLLQVAAFFGAEKCFKMLHKKGAKLHKKDSVGWDCAVYVACGGNTNIVSSVEKYNLNFYKTPSYAAQYMSYDVLDWLFEKRTKDIGDIQKELRNVMCASARTNNYRTFLNCLERHQKVRNKDRKGENALIAAARSGWLTFVKFVLMFDNIDPNSKDSHERTALHIAAMNGYIDIVNYLLHFDGVSLKLTDEDDNNALMLAASKGNVGVVKLLLPLFDINSTNLKGMTALHFACKANSSSCVQALVRVKANKEAVDDAGKKPSEYITDPSVLELL